MVDYNEAFRAAVDAVLAFDLTEGAWRDAPPLSQCPADHADNGCEENAGRPVKRGVLVEQRIAFRQPQQNIVDNDVQQNWANIRPQIAGAVRSSLRVSIALARTWRIGHVNQATLAGWGRGLS